VRNLMRSAPARRTLMAFVASSLIGLIVIGLATTVVARYVAQQEALSSAEQNTERLGRVLVAPLLADVLAGKVEKRDELDRAVRVRLADHSIEELDVWDATGKVVYSDELRSIGRTFPVPGGVTAAIERGETTSDIDTTDEAGNLAPGSNIVEVYTPLDVPGLPRLAFEVYYSSAQIDQRAATLTTELLLLGLVPLVVLQLVQVPIAVSLARRLARREAERTDLMSRALSASEKERRAIASDLHDGVVQELAGVGYALGAISPSVPEGLRPVAQSCENTVRSAVEGLRRLMVDIYPPDLNGSGLATAVEQLAGPLRTAGTEVEMDAVVLPDLDADTAATLYRVARESLVNVAKHAQAAHVRIELGPEPGSSDVVLRISDDGVGPGPDVLTRREDGHFGLTMLRDRVYDLGGRFTIAPGKDGGTVAEAVLPVSAQAR
jgi:two-component system, NarL family, sensor kinase